MSLLSNPTRLVRARIPVAKNVSSGIFAMAESTQNHTS